MNILLHILIEARILNLFQIHDIGATQSTVGFPLTIPSVIHMGDDKVFTNNMYKTMNGFLYLQLNLPLGDTQFLMKVL